MLRALTRLLGFLLIAAGFVAAVMDGARSIAHGRLDYATVGDSGLRVLGDRFLLIQPAVERHAHPLLWDPVMLTALLAPTSLLLLGLGLLVYRLGKRGDHAIGHLLRS